MSATTDENPAQWAVDLLTNDDRYIPPYIKYFYEIAGVCSGPALHYLKNRIIGVPGHSNIFGYVRYTVGSFAFIWVVSRFLKERQYQLNALAIDYIKLHPDRFPPPESQKYRDVFNSWTPFR